MESWIFIWIVINVQINEQVQIDSILILVKRLKNIFLTCLSEWLIFIKFT